MRVAVLVRKFPKLSETFILNQITGLIDAGVDVEIFAWAAGDSRVVHSDVQAYDLMRRTHYVSPPKSRLGRVATGAFATAASAGGLWQRPSVALRCLRGAREGRWPFSPTVYAAAAFVRNGPHDIVHCQFGQPGLRTLPLREVGAVSGRTVVSFRGWDLTGSRDREGYELLFRTADLFLPVCDAFRDRLIRMGCDPDRTLVHHSGIDLSRFAFSARAGDGRPTRLVTVARLVEKKGVEYGIRAMARLKESGREIRYTIVGDGPLRPALEDLVEELRLGDVVRFEGSKDHGEVREALAAAHVLLAPSVTAANGDQEGIPNALKEAMATGLPVVSTLHSGVPELVEDGVSGFLVPERDAKGLADRVAYLVDRPGEWGAMGRAGRARIEAEYDVRALNLRLMELYRELL